MPLHLQKRTADVVWSVAERNIKKTYLNVQKEYFQPAEVQMDNSMC